MGKYHITSPNGFIAAGVACGIKQSGEDLAIIASESAASCAIVTTDNQIIGEPIRYCRRIMPNGYGRARGIVINSGCSNVCTGPAGLKNTEAMASLTAERMTQAGLGTVQPKQILVASTGVIGEQIPMKKIRAGIADAAKKLSTENDRLVARAIMTTDTREKSAVVRTKIGAKTVTIAGIAKGAGMIAPSLATMISVITTDAAIAPSTLGAVLRSAVGETFNAVTIDSDMSTSDIVAIFANGRAENKSIPARRTDGDFQKFSQAVCEVCDHLARSIAADGEGATKFIEVSVTGAMNDTDAKIAAKSVADSPLVKCAANGADPNWGRIAMALGKSSAKIDQQKLKIKIGQTLIFSRGKPCKFDEKKVRKHLTGKSIKISCDLQLKNGKFKAYTCDLSKKYITINADYHT